MGPPAPLSPVSVAWLGIVLLLAVGLHRLATRNPAEAKYIARHPSHHALAVPHHAERRALFTGNTDVPQDANHRSHPQQPRSSLLREAAQLRGRLDDLQHAPAGAATASAETLRQLEEVVGALQREVRALELRLSQEPSLSDDLEAGPPLHTDQPSGASAPSPSDASWSLYITQWWGGQAAPYLSGRWQQVQPTVAYLQDEGTALVSSVRDKGAALLRDVTQNDLHATAAAVEQGVRSLANYLTEAYNENPELKEVLEPVYEKAMATFRDLSASIEPLQRTIQENVRNAGIALKSSQRLAAAAQEIDRAKRRIEAVWKRPDPLPKRLFAIAVVVGGVVATGLLSVVACMSGLLQRMVDFVVDWLGVSSVSPGERAKLRGAGPKRHSRPRSATAELAQEADGTAGVAQVAVVSVVSAALASVVTVHSDELSQRFSGLVRQVTDDLERAQPLRRPPPALVAAPSDWTAPDVVLEDTADLVW
eukprot:EG_transcript_7659